MTSAVDAPAQAPRAVGDPPPDLVLLAHAHLRAVRREAAEKSLETFCRIYLRGRFTLPFAPMHRAAIAALEQVADRTTSRLALALPKGYGKTELVAVAFVLWAVACRRERHVVLVGESQEECRELLTALREELLGNPLLREDFPRACLINAGSSGDIVGRDGFKIAAVERLQRMRGRRRHGSPPTLVVMDDAERVVEDPDAPMGERGLRYRHEVRGWMTSWIDSELAPGVGVVVVGSILDYDCLLAQLVDRREHREWEKVAAKAVVWSAADEKLWDEWEKLLLGYGPGNGPEAAWAFYDARRVEMGYLARVAWPEKHSYYDLMVMKAKAARKARFGGPSAFLCEMQNDPPAGERARRRREGPALDVGSAYDATGRFCPEDDFECQPGERRWGAFDPEIHLPWRQRRRPQFVHVIENIATGARRVVEADPHQRWIHDVVNPVVIACARECARTGVPMTLDLGLKSLEAWQDRHYQDLWDAEIRRRWEARREARKAAAEAAAGRASTASARVAGPIESTQAATQVPPAAPATSGARAC